MDILSRIKEDKGFVGNAMHIPREAQAKARRLCWKFNNSDPDDPKAQRDILMRLFGFIGVSDAQFQVRFWIQHSFQGVCAGEL